MGEGRSAHVVFRSSQPYSYGYESRRRVVSGMYHPTPKTGKGLRDQVLSSPCLSVGDIQAPLPKISGIGKKRMQFCTYFPGNSYLIRFEANGEFLATLSNANVRFWEADPRPGLLSLGQNERNPFYWITPERPNS